MPSVATAFNPYLSYNDIFARRVSSNNINMNRNHQQGTSDDTRSNTNSRHGSINSNNNNNSGENSSTTSSTLQRRHKILDALPSPFPPIKNTVNGTAIIDNDEMSDSVLTDDSLFEMVHTPCTAHFAKKLKKFANKNVKQNELQTKENVNKHNSAKNNSDNTISSNNDNNMETILSLQHCQNSANEENTSYSNRSVTTNSNNMHNRITNTLPQITTTTSSTPFSSFSQQPQEEENVSNNATSLFLPQIAEEHNNITADNNERETNMSANDNININYHRHLESTESNTIINSNNINNIRSTGDNRQVNYNAENTAITATKGRKRSLFSRLADCCSHSREQEQEQHDESKTIVEPVTEHKRDHKILNVLDGGYVVFTDSYLDTHPDSSIADLSLAYQEHVEGILHSGYAIAHHTNSRNNSNGNNTNTHSSSTSMMPDNAMLSDYRSCLQRVRRCIDDVQHQRRPLFRRINSDVVYGRAMYISTSNNDNKK